ncbi:hypothetical protein K9L05_03215, partial [Candidatus Babeliales bacterium]|nr:hypothetical protein [Candidatus Babeliales bacterium]
MKHYIKLLLVVFLFGSLNAEKKIETRSPETKGFLSGLFGGKTEEVKSNLPSNSDIAALIEDLDTLEAKGYNHHNYNCCPPKRLNVCEICARKIYVKCLEAKVARIKCLFARKAKIEKIWSKVISTCDLCAKKAKIEKLWVDCEFVKRLSACEAKINKLYANDICFDDLCTKYRADLEITNTVFGYVLGDNVPYDTIVDDPNNNVSLTPYPHYKAPKTGYYVVSIGFDSTNLRGIVPTPITGTPVSHPEIIINGVHYLHEDSVFLTFVPNLQTVLTTILPLKKGDMLSSRFGVLFETESGAVIEYPGLIDITNKPHHSFMRVHYLSSTCQCKPCDIQYCECPI